MHTAATIAVALTSLIANSDSAATSRLSCPTTQRRNKAAATLGQTSERRTWGGPRQRAGAVGDHVLAAGAISCWQRPDHVRGDRARGLEPHVVRRIRVSQAQFIGGSDRERSSESGATRDLQQVHAVVSGRANQQVAGSGEARHLSRAEEERDRVERAGAGIARDDPNLVCGDANRAERGIGRVGRVVSLVLRCRASAVRHRRYERAAVGRVRLEDSTACHRQVAEIAKVALGRTDGDVACDGEVAGQCAARCRQCVAGVVAGVEHRPARHGQGAVGRVVRQSRPNQRLAGSCAARGRSKQVDRVAAHGSSGDRAPGVGLEVVEHGPDHAELKRIAGSPCAGAGAVLRPDDGQRVGRTRRDLDDLDVARAVGQRGVEVVRAPRCGEARTLPRGDRHAGRHVGDRRGQRRGGVVCVKNWHQAALNSSTSSSLAATATFCST